MRRSPSVWLTHEAYVHPGSIGQDEIDLNPVNTIIEADSKYQAAGVAVNFMAPASSAWLVDAEHRWVLWSGVFSAVWFDTPEFF